MDYSKYSLEELELMLDDVVNDYANGDMHHATFAIEFERLRELIAIMGDQKESLEAAYERAMRGVC